MHLTRGEVRLYLYFCSVSRTAFKSDLSIFKIAINMARGTIASANMGWAESLDGQGLEGMHPYRQLGDAPHKA